MKHQYKNWVEELTKRRCDHYDWENLTLSEMIDRASAVVDYVDGNRGSFWHERMGYHMLKGMIKAMMFKRDKG